MLRISIFFGAIECISGYVTAPSATETALTVCAGNSLTIRAAKEGSKIHILQAWGKTKGAGIVKILSPRMHDNVQNLRLNRIAAKNAVLLPAGFKQLVYPQDTLRVLMTGSATAADIETFGMLIHYEELEGAEGRFATWDEIQSRIKNWISVPVSITTAATGEYSGQVAINSTYDLMKANTDYALIGWNSSGVGGTVRYQGIDTGNLGVGGPATTEQEVDTKNWFKNLSDRWNIPCIPILNSANKAGILIDVTQDEDAAAVVIYSILAELD